MRSSSDSMLSGASRYVACSWLQNGDARIVSFDGLCYLELVHFVHMRLQMGLLFYVYGYYHVYIRCESLKVKNTDDDGRRTDNDECTQNDLFHLARYPSPVGNRKTLKDQVAQMTLR